jgi:glycosyltransferase involved in cell wall biosynthesis
MKIIHVLAYYGDYLGGLQNYVRELAKRQKAEGHDVKIITSTLYGNQKEIDGVQIIRCKSWFSLFRTPFVPSLPFKLLVEDCDVVHAHLPSPGLDLSVTFKKWLNPKAKLIVTIHNYAPKTSFLKKIFSWVNNNILIGFALRKADKIIFTTRGFADSLTYSFDKKKEIIIPLGVDLKKFNPKEKWDKNQILFVGRMIPEKGLHILVKAVKSLKDKYPELKLLAIVSEVYGGFNKYESELKKEGKGFLKILRNIPNELISKHYAGSNMLVMPSLDIDSFGFVLIEAMACGCPVITSDLSGPASIVNKNVGLVVPRGNINETAKAIISLLNKGKDMRKNCRKYAEENFNWDNINKKILEIYRK